SASSRSSSPMMSTWAWVFLSASTSLCAWSKRGSLRLCLPSLISEIPNRAIFIQDCRCSHVPPACQLIPTLRQRQSYCSLGEPPQQREHERQQTADETYPNQTTEPRALFGMSNQRTAFHSNGRHLIHFVSNNARSDAELASVANAQQTIRER